MGTFILLAIACALVSLTQAALTVTKDQEQILAEYHKVCTEQSGVDGAILEELLTGNFPEDLKFKEYLLCISKKVGFQNEAGEIQKDVVVEKLAVFIKDTSKAEELVEKCSEQEGSPSDVVYGIVNCLYNSTPNHIIIVE